MSTQKNIWVEMVTNTRSHTRKMISGSEARVWDLLSGDLVRAVAAFLPMIPLTPRGIWHLTAADKNTREALKEWLYRFKTEVMEARHFCTKFDKQPDQLMYASRLTLPCSMFSDNDLKVFSFNIRKGSANLMHLGLGDNKIGDEGMKAFSAALSSGSMGSLQKLYLNDNQIGDAGMAAFAEALKPNPSNPMGALGSLQEIFISGNQISDEGMTAFSTALSSGSLASLK